MSTLSPTEIDQIIKSRPAEDIVSREFKHGTYAPHRYGAMEDCTVVKEWITYKDGLRVPTITPWKNFKRPIWITKEHLRERDRPIRDEIEKIQFESLDNVDVHYVPQIQLRRKIADILHLDPRLPLRQLCRSPYIFGADPGPEVFINHKYKQRYPNCFKDNTVTVVDCETNVWKEGREPILWSEVSDDEIVLYYDTQWTVEHPNYGEDVIAEYKRGLENYLDQIRDFLRNKKTGKYPAWIDDVPKIPVRAVGRAGPMEITRAMVNNLHHTQPDFVTGWNVFFDASVINNTCIQFGEDPADVLSDPRVPLEFRNVFLYKGRETKAMDSGREMRLDPMEQWDRMTMMASFRFMDSMQTFWQLRKAKGKENGGYGLGAVGERHLGVGKAIYEVADSSIPEGTLHWHMEMQRWYKVRYGSYSIYDSLIPWALNKKNADLSGQITALAGYTDYSRFNSQPTINATDMLFDALEEDRKIICSTSDRMLSQKDLLLPGKDGIIVTFPAHNVVNSGIYLYEDMPTIQSNIYLYSSDADVEMTYPTGGVIQNVGKETTLSEPYKVEGATLEEFRNSCINVTGGRVNALEIMQTLGNLKPLEDWVELARSEFDLTG